MKSLSSMFAGSFGSAVRRNGSHLALLLAALCVMFAVPALAQEATIVGTVTDPTGASVPNASITITNTDTGVARSQPTSGDKSPSPSAASSPGRARRAAVISCAAAIAPSV